MPSHRTALVWINVLGGIAVLGSYAYGFVAHPDEVGLAWGGIPVEWRGLYSAAMFPAALGYFPMTFFLLFRSNLEQSLRGSVRLRPALILLYCAILIASALWMPLTFAYLAAPSAALWAGIWFVLGVVALASLGLTAVLLQLRPAPPTTSWRLALLGSLFFAFQTVILDAGVWPSLFVIA
ncbi:MAG: hypothetical protein VCB42_00650 [Myxococcota bacterium]